MPGRVGNGTASVDGRGVSAPPTLRTLAVENSNWSGRKSRNAKPCGSPERKMLSRILVSLKAQRSIVPLQGIAGGRRKRGLLLNTWLSTARGRASRRVRTDRVRGALSRPIGRPHRGVRGVSDIPSASTTYRRHCLEACRGRPSAATSVPS